MLHHVRNAIAHLVAAQTHIDELRPETVPDIFSILVGVLIRQLKRTLSRLLDAEHHDP